MKSSSLELSREAAANQKKKKNRKANKQKDKGNLIEDTGITHGITQNLTKSVLPADKKSIFNISAQTEETETNFQLIEKGIGKFQTKLRTFQYVGDYKKTVIFVKNELKPSLFVQNIIESVT